MSTRLHRAGIYAWFGLDVPFADRFGMMRDAGFDASALWWEEDDPRARTLRHSAPDIVRRAGLYLDNIHVPYQRCNDLWSNNDSVREAIVAQHLGWLDDCARHSVPRLVMHATLGTHALLDEVCGIESFRRLVGRAEELGVTVAVENTRRNSRLSALFDAIDSPSLGLCYDCSHDRLYGEPPIRIVETFATRLVATHFSDTDGKRDYHWLPGDGVVDFESLGAAFPAQSFAGTYMLEVVSRDKEASAASFLAEARRRLQVVIEHCSMTAAPNSRTD